MCRKVIVGKLKKWIVFFDEYKTIKNSPLFDREFYIKNNPGISLTFFSPLIHFLLFGWKEKRNPSASFDVLYYLQKYGDVRREKLNPLYQYLKWGKKEGRFKNANEENNTSYELHPVLDTVFEEGPIEIPHKQLLQIKSAITGHFDENYYLQHIANADSLKMDPLTHYIAYGWKENRDPSPFFSTAYYLNANPDVKRSGMNPLYHYVTIGKKENREPVHPLREHRKIESLQSLHRRLQRSKDMPSRTTVETASLFDKIKHSDLAITKGLIISISHNKYIDTSAGVELCVSQEQKIFNDSGFTYLNISPARVLHPTLAFDVNPEEWLGNIIIDGNFVGTFKGQNIIQSVATFKETVEMPLHIAIHALQNGHSIPFLVKLIKAAQPAQSFFWIHDYYSICISYNLLRNDVRYCHAPNASSPACRICLYGEARKRHMEAMEVLFNATPFTVVAPSESAFSIWEQHSSYPHIDHKIIPHKSIAFDNLSTSANHPIENNKKIKVAFIGRQSDIKGWPTFTRLTETFRNDSRYEFYHLGLRTENSRAFAKFMEVRSTPDEPDKMTQAVKTAGIDIVLLWSICPETYSLVAMEVMAGGALIITNPQSGNIRALVTQYERGKIFETEEMLFTAFQSNEIAKWAKKAIENGIPTGSLSSSNFTYSCIQS